MAMMECGCTVNIEYGEEGETRQSMGFRISYHNHPRETVEHGILAVTTHLARVATAYENADEREYIDALQSVVNAAVGLRDAVYSERGIETVRIGG